MCIKASITKRSIEKKDKNTFLKQTYLKINFWNRELGYPVYVYLIFKIGFYFVGDVCLCHVIFGGKGITSHMAPKETVEKIDELLIYLTKNNVNRPVVVLSDGHSSRFDFDVLQFLRNKEIHLFITPPDTTGIKNLISFKLSF